MGQHTAFLCAGIGPGMDLSVRLIFHRGDEQSTAGLKGSCSQGRVMEEGGFSSLGHCAAQWGGPELMQPSLLLAGGQNPGQARETSRDYGPCRS